jgi:PAS domain S-box-containing protein
MTTERARFSRLLLVEDIVSLRLTLTGILENEGFAVTGCETALEALEHIRRKDFGVAVVDLRLPDMQGTKLLKEFRKLGSRVRVIINTAYGAFESAKDAINFGAFAYIEKASDPRDLVRQVQRAQRSHFERYADDLEAAVAERSAELLESEKRLRLLFENAPVSLWHEDFSQVKCRIDELRQEGVTDFREYFEANLDVVVECAELVRILDINLATRELHQVETRSELTEMLTRCFCDDSYKVFREELIALAEGKVEFESDAETLATGGEKKVVMLRLFVDPKSEDWSSVYVAITDITERKRAEDGLRHSEALLSKAQSISHIGSFEWDINSDRLVGSDELYRIYGIKRGEFDGSINDVMPLIDPADHELIQTGIEQLLKEGLHGGLEFRIIRPDGATRTVFAEAEFVSVEEDESPLIVGFVQDITERKDAEKALRESEAWLREAQTIARLGSYDWDLLQDRIRWSDEMYEIYGFDKCTVPDLEAVRQCIVPEDRSIVDDAMASMSRCDIPESIEYRIIRSDGELRHVVARARPVFDQSGQMARLVGTLQDITQQKKSEQRYQTVADHTYAWEVWENPDKSFNYVSPACEEISGYSAEEFLADPMLFDRLVLAEDREIWSAHSHESISQIQSRREIQFRIKRKDGITVWIDHSCQPVTDKHGAFLGYRASNRDITERKNAEEELRQRDAEMAHVTRVGTMGEMATVLAHEVNQPLGAIANYAGTCVHLLESDQVNIDLLRNALTQIDQQARCAGEIINGLKRFVARTAPNCSQVDLSELIHDVCGLMRSQIQTHRVSLRLNLDESVPKVEADAIQIQQVLVNLIQNALEAMADNEPARSWITVTSKMTADGAQVAVCDLGQGMSPQVQEKLFEPYFSTKPKGLGMGLRISQRIIQKHGGSLSASLNPDGGTIFQFTLPCKLD